MYFCLIFYIAGTIKGEFFLNAYNNLLRICSELVRINTITIFEFRIFLQWLLSTSFGQRGWAYTMITSSYGSAFPITGLLWGESTGHQTKLDPMASVHRTQSIPFSQQHPWRISIFKSMRWNSIFASNLLFIFSKHMAYLEISTMVSFDLTTY